jgi:predicted AAA+ superfamily ATPase
MINRPFYLERLTTAMGRSPITALLGPRQAGKTTLARLLAESRPVTFFDLESQPDVRRLQNPELALSSLNGLVVIDEIQVMPELFAALRVLVDRPGNRARFLILGSASPDIVRNVSETLAGRVEFIELAPFNLSEVNPERWRDLWVRGGFPRAFLAASDEDSVAWRESFIHTFLERDIPQLGFTIPPSAMRRFWTMLAHYHAQTWNASELGRAMGLTDKTVRSYLDLLTGAYLVRQLQPWYANIRKRQVRAPKVYLRDTGLLHTLLGLGDWEGLLAHPRAGASWEGFAIEQTLQVIRPAEAYFWATHSGAELDLLFFRQGRRYGAEAKFNEAPEVTRSMRIALEDLALDHLWVIHPGPHTYAVHEKVTVCAIADLLSLPAQIAQA